MPKVTPEYRESRRAEITAAALTCFARKGFQGASMSEIIAESGLSAGAIYGHFASKDEIVEAVAREILDRRRNTIADTVTRSPIPKPVDVLLEFFAEKPLVADQRGMIVQLWAAAVTDDALRAIAARNLVGFVDSFADYLTAWLRTERGVPAERARERGVAAAPLVMAVVQGYAVQAALVPDFDGDAYFAAFADISERI